MTQEINIKEKTLLTLFLWNSCCNEFLDEFLDEILDEVPLLNALDANYLTLRVE